VIIAVAKMEYIYNNDFLITVTGIEIKWDEGIGPTSLVENSSEYQIINFFFLIWRTNDIIY
jgi:hypothetical protein